MQLLILRHAARNASDGDDGSLNERGRAQADQLFAQLQPTGRLPLPTHLLSSPKNRARQTLQPLARRLELPLAVRDELDERRQDETGLSFRVRVQNFFARIEAEFGVNDVVFVCSHLDFLEEAMVVVPAELSDLDRSRSFSPAAFILFEINDGQWKRAIESN